MTKFSLSPSEKKEAYEKELQRKIIPRSALVEKVKHLKSQGLTIATLNGSFDLLQAGHLYILFEAKKQADILIVAVNSDASIKKYKSTERPIIPLEYRLKMLSSIQWVDYLTFFDEVDPCLVLADIAPHVHVNGVEYGDNCIERDTIERCGGKMYLVDRIDGLSTSAIIKKIKGLCD